MSCIHYFIAEKYLKYKRTLKSDGFYQQPIHYQGLCESYDWYITEDPGPLESMRNLVMEILCTDINEVGLSS